MKPKPNGPNGGRGEDGRFLAGNPGGPGNPYSRQVAKLRQAILDAVTPQDVAEMNPGPVAASEEWRHGSSQIRS